MFMEWKSMWLIRVTLLILLIFSKPIYFRKLIGHFMINLYQIDWRAICELYIFFNFFTAKVQLEFFIGPTHCEMNKVCTQTSFLRIIIPAFILFSIQKVFYNRYNWHFRETNLTQILLLHFRGLTIEWIF